MGGPANPRRRSLADVGLLRRDARSAIGLDVYRVGMDGTGLRRLSTRTDAIKPFFNPSRTLFLDSWSDVNTPPQVRLHAPNGETSASSTTNPVPALKEYRLSKPELLQVKTRDGFVMEAMMIKPPDFDPSRRYPVYQFTYAGPHLQQVVNALGQPAISCITSSSRSTGSSSG